MRDKLDALGRRLTGMPRRLILRAQTLSQPRGQALATSGLERGPGQRRTGEAQAEICGRVVGEAEQVAAEHVREIHIRRDGRKVGLQRCRDGQGCHLLAWAGLPPG